MANKEQLALLKQGVRAWNEWRTLNQTQTAKVVSLRGARLTGANLDGANLSAADLRQAHLSGAHLSAADLSAADLGQADLTNARLTGANLDGAHLISADLRRAHLSGARLSRAKLNGADLGRADLSDARLTEADLGRARLWEANLRQANLSGAHLIAASLIAANLIQANLSGAHLSRAHLGGANLKDARLAGADLDGANLTDARLIHADLARANLSRALLFETLLCDVDLSEVIGLDVVRHHGPSSLDHRTLLRSGRLPLAFLRGCGLPDRLIEYLPSLLNAGPIQCYSCFISYSTTDQDFADRLHADLQARGVRCWFAPHDMQPGRKMLDQIDEAIRVYDRLLLILSTTSMSSEWVRTEIEKAREKERTLNRQVLFPIALVPFSEIRAWKQFNADVGEDMAREIREYHLPDFRDWKTNHDGYQQSLEKVVAALRERR